MAKDEAYWPGPSQWVEVERSRLDALEAERAVWEAETAEARRQSSEVVQIREERDALKARIAELEEALQMAIERGNYWREVADPA